MTQNGTHGSEPIDFDAIVAKHYGTVKIRGVIYTILPVNALTQRHMREIRKSVESGTELTEGEVAAKIVRRCLDPEPSDADVEAMPTAVLVEVARLASKGLEELDKGGDPNGDGGTTPPTPPSLS